MLIRDAQIRLNARAAVRLARGIVTAIDEHLVPLPGEEIVDAGGAALLPGLHDHHLHLMSLAASLDSLICAALETERSFAARLRAKARECPNGVRVVGYHESIAGEIGRDWLDAAVPHVPVRVQHRSGRLWIFNSIALDVLRENARDLSPLEREGRHITGRLYDGDAWLRATSAGAPPTLDRASALLAAFGITGVTDASVGNDHRQFEIFRAAQDRGDLLQDLRVMGDMSLGPEGARAGLSVGAVKFHLHDGELPAPEELGRAFAAAHDVGRAVAIHCVTLADLVLALSALQDAGAMTGDRIEHAGICPPDLYPLMSSLGVTVVTNANFVAERGDDYIRDIAPREHAWLYPCRSLMDAGIPVAGGTDSPFGAPDPWAAMQAAVTRRTRSGVALGEEERIAPEEALDLFLAPLGCPGACPREIEIGAKADLCVLDRTWARAREELSAVRVALTLKDGVPIWRRQETISSINPHCNAPRADMRRAESAR